MTHKKTGPHFAEKVFESYKDYRCSTCYYGGRVVGDHGINECEVLTTVGFPACGAWASGDRLGGYTMIGYVRRVGAIGVFKAVRFRLVALNRDNARYLAREVLTGMGYEIHHTLAFHPSDDISVERAIMTLAAEDI